MNTEKKKRSPVDVVVFVKTWSENQGNVDKVVNELQRSRQQVLNRYKKLTALGVKLCEPVYKARGAKKLEFRVEELNQLIAELQ